MQLDLQNTLTPEQSRQYEVPDTAMVKQWTETVLAAQSANVEMTIRITDMDEITQLNRDYRGQNKPTNVLSFPFDSAVDIEGVELIGDVIICAPVVMQQALEQHKSTEAHWAHMVIHGTLHLLGYDHISDDEANEMESLEILLLEKLGYTSPY